MPFKKPAWLSQKKGKRKKALNILAKSQGDLTASLIALTIEPQKATVGASGVSNTLGKKVEEESWRQAQVCLDLICNFLDTCVKLHFHRNFTSPMED